MSPLNLLQQIDLSILFFINHQLANPIFDFIFKFLHYSFYFLVGLLVLYFIFKKEKFVVLLMIITIIASLVVSGIIKIAVARERPYQALDIRQLVTEDDNRSFPSNRVLLSFALSTIVFSINRRFGLVLFLLSLIVGIGRIYVGVHYPSDVLGGAIIGILLAFLILRICDRYKKEVLALVPFL